MKAILIVCFMASLAVQPTSAQFEVITDCLDSSFMPKFLSCLIGSIDIQLNIDSISMAQDDTVNNQEYEGYDTVDDQVASRKHSSPASRILGGDFSNGVRKTFINKKLKDMGIDSTNVLHEMKQFGKALSLGSTTGPALDIFKNIDLKKLIKEDYVKSHYHQFKGLISKGLQVKQYLDKYVEDHGVTRETRNTFECFGRFPPPAFEDGIEWLQCLFTCKSLHPLATCSAEVFKTGNRHCQSIPWFSDVLVAIISSSFINTSHCLFEVESPTNITVPIELKEGGPEKAVRFNALVPPEVMCYGADPLGEDGLNFGLMVAGHVFGFDVTCDVEMQITSSNWLDDINMMGLGGKPQCRVAERALRQIAIGFHPAAVNNSAVFKITKDNWNETFEIPILPTVDHRADGDAEATFTMKLHVQGSLRGETVKIPVTVEDTDPFNLLQSSAVYECYSVNDPHIMTFDGRYYNNFHHGAFYLYKHDTMPYEVQAIYQPCEHGNDQGTCTCAVAVRSGDDVFVVDRCRRKGEGCPENGCDPVQTVVLYTNGEVTPGMRVFSQNEGLRHDVVLPHGTIVKVITSNNLLNVWVLPGSYDKDNTKGLCGIFNADASDDLTMPDGTLYTGTEDQPKPFNTAWRVPVDELMFEGSPSDNDGFSPLEACYCSHVLMVGANCECGRGTVVEICDLFLGYEYTESNISSIISPSNYNGTGHFLGDLDLDLTYEPDDNLPQWSGEWSEVDATIFCENLLSTSTNDIIELCRRHSGITDFDAFAAAAKQACIEDIQILDNTNWKNSALDNLKYRCYNAMYRDLRLSVTNRDELVLYVNSSCINECNDNGDCVNGVCECSVGFSGPDCGVVGGEDTSTPVLTPQDTEICDNRKQRCEFATFRGHNLLADGSLLCRTKNVEVTYKGVDFLPLRKVVVNESNVVVISDSQAACPIPSNGSYSVEVVWHSPEDLTTSWSLTNILHEGMKLLPQRMKRSGRLLLREMALDMRFIYITYDSMCFECFHGNQSCTIKQTADFCWIKRNCWAPGETKPDDPCRYCSPGDAKNDWTMHTDEVCAQQAEDEAKAERDRLRDLKLRGGLGGGISGLVVIIIIIVFCVTRKRARRKATKEEESFRNTTVIPKNGTVYYGDGSDHGYTNKGMDEEDDTDNEHYEEVRRFSDNGQGTPQPSNSVTRVDVLKSQGNPSTDRLSNASFRSNGSQASMKTPL